jgi:hypothetical protein
LLYEIEGPHVGHYRLPTLEGRSEERDPQKDGQKVVQEPHFPLFFELGFENSPSEARRRRKYVEEGWFFQKGKGSTLSKSIQREFQDQCFPKVSDHGKPKVFEDWFAYVSESTGIDFSKIEGRVCEDSFPRSKGPEDESFLLKEKGSPFFGPFHTQRGGSHSRLRKV